MAKVHKRHSALKRSVIRSLMGCIIDGAALAALLAGAVWQFGTIDGWLRDDMSFFGFPVRILIPIAGTLTLIGLILRLRHNARRAAIRRAGAQGEDLALKQLQKALPASYHLFNNVVVNYDGGRSETDLIVVGPGGVTVVEIKNYTGELQGRADAARLTHIKSRGSESVYNPMRQVATHVHRVSGYLRQQHRGVWVRSAVYFVNPRLRAAIEGRSETPWFTSDQLDGLTMMLRSGQPPLTTKQIEGIVEVLQRI